MKFEGWVAVDSVQEVRSRASSVGGSRAGESCGSRSCCRDCLSNRLFPSAISSCHRIQEGSSNTYSAGRCNRLSGRHCCLCLGTLSGSLHNCLRGVYSLLWGCVDLGLLDFLCGTPLSVFGVLVAYHHLGISLAIVWIGHWGVTPAQALIRSFEHFCWVITSSEARAWYR